jgi:hypothetical protein
VKNLYIQYRNNYNLLYFWILLIIVAVMPHSRALLSSAQIGLACMWILEADFIRKFLILKERKSIIIFSSIFLIHILGLIHTENFSYAFNDLKIKLPLILFPVVIGTSKKIEFEKLKLIIKVFTVSLIIKSIYGIAQLKGIFGVQLESVHEMAGKYSHIRFAIMINIAIFSNLFLLFQSFKQKWTAIIYSFSIVWLFIFLIILQSVTGWVLFFLAALYSFIYLSKNLKKNIKLIVSTGFAVFFLSSIIYIIFAVNKFYITDELDAKNIELHTKSGNPYEHNFKSLKRENGHFTDIYFCETELEDEWNKKSSFKYSGFDKKNQPIKYTLIRYLSSKNLRKDKEGVNCLSPKDIKNIESGITNYIFENRFAVYPKIYEILWQAESYKLGENPENHSVTQRIEFVKNAILIIQNNFWVGVGTGDVKDVTEAQYKKSASKLSAKNRLRAHNQFITFTVSFGILGLIWILFALVFPIFKEQKFGDYLFMIVFIILTLSMLNEDTLETQMGASIFAFFLSLFLFSSTQKLLYGKTTL